MERRRPKSPRIPARFANYREFGEVIGWGTFDAAALARAQTVTRAEMLAIGMTVEIATDWLQVYEYEAAFNPGNPGARGRSELMRPIVQLLKE